VFLGKTSYPHCLELVGSGEIIVIDINKKASFLIELKQISINGTVDNVSVFTCLSMY